MCKNSYEKISQRTKKPMLFCKLFGEDGALSQLCINQRYCPRKARYIEIGKKEICKKYVEEIYRK